MIVFMATDVITFAENDLLIPLLSDNNNYHFFWVLHFINQIIMRCVFRNIYATK
jgi:hypothetical protein